MADRDGALARYQQRRRFALAAFFVAAFGMLLFCSSRAGPGSEWHEGIEAVGLTLIGLCVLGRLWSTLYIGGRKNTEIIAQGPYSLTRNPLYVFSAIGAAGVGAQTGSLVVALVFGVAIALAFLVVIRREEAFLRETFGQAFEEYCARVPRFLPRFSGFESGGMLTVSPKRLYNTLLDGLIFFAAIPAFEAVEWLQQSGFIPVVLHLP